MGTRIYRVKIGPVYVSKVGYYSFDFFLYVNGKLREWGNLDGDFSGQTAEAFRHVLKRGWAYQLVLQRFF